ncbi:MAG: peptidase S41, partial [Sphingobacteriales bacterium]
TVTTVKNIKSETYLSDPSISPDGSEIAFVSGGDIWTVSSAGGKARLLIARPGYDSRPLYSPDGQFIAFNSTITGSGDVYTYNLKTGALNRLTYDDANEEINGWSADSKLIYLTSPAKDISGMKDVFKVKVSGGTPMAVTDNRFITEFFAAPSPDGKSVAFNMRGMSSVQWWRNGRSHLDESEIWIRQTSGGSAYTPFTKGGARDLWPMWNKDGSGMYFISDRTGTQNLWFSSLKGEAKQLTKFSSGRMIWPSMAANGESIVFEKDFKIWKYSLADGKATELPVTLVGAATIAGTEHLRLTNQFRDVTLSPDGKKIAFVARGEVFVAGAKEGGDAYRV